MRILYLGPVGERATAYFYCKAFQTLGHETVALDPKYFLAGTFGQRIGNWWRKAPSVARVRSVNASIVALARKTYFDLVFVMGENFLDAETLMDLKAIGCRVIYHSHDNNFSEGICKPDHFFETLRVYDRVFTTKSQNVERYRALGQGQSFFLPSAYEPSIHRPVKESAFQQWFDFTFVGTYDRSRVPLLEAVGWDNLYIWGDNWKRFPSYLNRKSRIVAHAIYNNEYADVLSHSKVVLGLLREEAEDRHTQRTFEIPACGALQLAPRNDEILSFFEENREIVCFSSQEELRDRSRYLLKHDKERQQIAESGYKRVTTDGHTYLDRTRTLLKFANS